MLISVIVPVWNAEKWLERCVRSVLGQTHADLELILVDDGSTDRSGAICDALAARDPRVRVLHKPNGGVSAARNDGLRMARGEWVAFADNDDFLAPGMLARLLEMCLQNDCQIAQCRCARGLADHLETPPREPVKVLTANELLENFYSEATIYIWDKIYRREVWDGIRFPEGSYTGEDLAVVHRLLGAARRVALTREALYYHFANPRSVMGRGFDVRWATGALDDRLAFARERGLLQLEADTLARRVYEQGYLLAMNRRHNPDRASRREFSREHRRLMWRFYGQAVAARRVRLRDRLMMSVRVFLPPAFHLYNWLKFRLRGLPVRFGEVK